MRRNYIFLIIVLIAVSILFSIQVFGQNKDDKAQGQSKIKEIGGIKFIKIPGGSFMMGSPEGEGQFDEKPRHKVTLDPFYLGAYEITQKQYFNIMGENPSEYKSDNLPVWNVSWDEAMQFCKIFSEKYNVKARLPYEAEWEYAIRAGSTTIYYWGNNMKDKYCWYDKNSDNKFHPVGTKHPNAWGLYDMCGNVKEWCMDFYSLSADYYKVSPEQNPHGPALKGSDAHTALRVVRGGSFSYSANDMRSARRLYHSSRYLYTGFRIVVSIP